MRTKFKILSLFIILCLTSSCYAGNYYDAGKKAFNSKDYNQASIQFKQALIDNPSNVNCRYYYAQSLIYLSKLEEAQKEYEKIIEISPSSEAANLASIGIAKLQKYIAGQKKDYSSTKNQSLRYIYGNDNYIENILTADGFLAYWDISKMPLKIYFDTSKKSTQSNYINSVKEALDQWIKVLDNSYLKYETVSDSKSANIKIYFVSSSMNKIKTDNHTEYLSGISTPYFKNEKLDYVEMKFSILKDNNTNISEEEMYNIALHELGHALGIWGHSNNESDIMYAIDTNDNNLTRKPLSARDINTIRLLYTLKDDIYQSSNQNARLEKKLIEAQDYVKKVPNQPMSWTVLGTTLQAMGRYFEAISSFQKALALDTNYTQAREELANTYKSMGDFSRAAIEYNNLISSQPADPKYYCDLASLYINNKRYQEAKDLMNVLITKNPKVKEDKQVKQILLYLK